MTKKRVKKGTYDKAFCDAVADHLLVWMKDPQNIWFKDFSLEYGVSWKYLAYELIKKSEKLKTALDIARQMQESKLVKAGFDAKNPAFYIFSLKNVAGWRDVVDESEDQSDQLLPFVKGMLKQKEQKRDTSKAQQ